MISVYLLLDFVAHKIIYMEVSPKGYNNNISVIYKVNTNK